MKSPKLATIVILAIVAGLPSATYAGTMDHVVAELRTESISPNQSQQTFFYHPPQLIRAAATQTGVYTPSTYEFTLTVPQNAGQPLKAVTIVQVESLETVKFDVSDSKAFFGEQLTASSEIRLASIGGNKPSKSGEVTIVFDKPVQPGSTVTVAVSTQKNPSWSNIYLFGVTAYPVGDDALGQFLGYGRINIYGD
jgi:Protein of unknown function (DUF2808)